MIIDWTITEGDGAGAGGGVRSIWSARPDPVRCALTNRFTGKPIEPERFGRTTSLTVV